MIRHLVLLFGMSAGITVTAFLLLPQSAPAQDFVFVSTPTYNVLASSTPATSATSYLVFDIDTGESIIERAADEVLPIASVTKLVSSAAFYDLTTLSDTAVLTASDIDTSGGAGRFAIGDEHTHHELIFASLLESSNDATAVMERVEPDLINTVHNIIKNDLASETFEVVDASGLSPQNKATAQDLAKLFVYLRERFPHIIDITNLPAYYTEDGGWLNNNPVSNDTHYLGGKHGYLPESGRTLVGGFEDTLHNGSVRKLGYVVLGSDNLTEDVAQLRSFVSEHVSYQ